MVVQSLSTGFTETTAGGERISNGLWTHKGTLQVRGRLSGQVADQGGQSYNVKAFGAVGNGTADDTAALQDAINAAWATHSVVELPAGTYLISAPLTVPGAGYTASSGFGMVGALLGGTTIKSVDGGADLAQLLLVGSTNFVQGLLLRDLTFQVGSGHATGHGLVLRCHASTVDNISVGNAPQDGIRLETPYGGNQFQHLTNCSIWTPGRDGLFVDTGVTDTTIDRLVVYSYGRYGIYNRGGAVRFLCCHPYAQTYGASKVSFYQDTGGLTEIIGGQYEGGNINIQITGVSNVGISGASLYDYAGSTPLSQIYVAGSSARVKVSGVQFTTLGTPATGVTFNNAAGCCLVDSTLNGCATGVLLQGGSTSINVAGNILNGSTFRGVTVTNGSRCTFSNNHITAGPSGGITEVAPSNFNIFNDNQLNGTTLTVVGASSVQHNNMP